jgi:hypothetical protein
MASIRLYANRSETSTGAKTGTDDPAKIANPESP